MAHHHLLAENRTDHETWYFSPNSISKRYYRFDIYNTIETIYLSRGRRTGQIFGDNACHPEPMRCAQGKLREGPGSMGAEILRFAQDDSPDPSPVRFWEPYLQTSPYWHWTKVPAP